MNYVLDRDDHPPGRHPFAPSGNRRRRCLSLRGGWRRPTLVRSVHPDTDEAGPVLRGVHEAMVIGGRSGILV